jgi:chemotaxis protein CheX
MSINVEVSTGHILVRSDKSVFDEDEAKECVNQIKTITEQRPLVVLDMSQANEMAAPALRILTRAASTFSQYEAKIAIVANKEIQKLIKDQGLDRLFECHGALSELIKPTDQTVGRQRALEFLNTTLEAVSYTLKVSTNTESKAERPRLRDKDAKTTADIAATVGLISAPFNGVLIIGFPKKTYLGIMGRMLGSSYTEITPEIADGAAELLNIILGQVKISLNERGFSIKQAIPTVAKGENIQVLPSSAKPSVVVPYKTDVGDFYIELTTNLNEPIIMV